MKGFGGPEVVLGGISSVKRGRISVTVGDTKKFIEIEIVEREISKLKCSLGFALVVIVVLVVVATVAEVVIVVAIFWGVNSVNPL